MAFSEISFSGLASGIDTNSIVEKLMMLERRPQTLLQEKVDLYTEKKNVYSTLSAKLSALNDIVNEINDTYSSFFSQKIVESTETSILEASISSTNPAVGTFYVNITQLATAAMVSSEAALYTGADAEARPAIAESTSAINAPLLSVDPAQSLASERTNFNTQPDTSGTIVINGVSIDWDDSMSLNEIIGLINNSGAGVTASFDSGTQIFSLESSLTGSTAEITISETAGNFWDAVNITEGTVNGSDAVKPDLTAAVGSTDAHLDRTVTSGTFTINGVIFNVDATTDSLQTILSRINNSNAGVTASYDESTGKVALTQKSTGSGNEIVLGAADDTSNLLYALKLSSNNPPVGGAADTYTGTDAQLSLNGGSTQTFSSNTIDGLIPGVTLTLNNTGNATVNVSTDIDSIVGTIKDFVNEYNGIMNYINSKIREERVEDPQTTAEKLQGAFTADPLFVETKYDLLQIMTSVVSDLPSTLNQLAQIGITPSATNYGKDATFEVDEEKLRGALTSNPDGVAAIFNDSSGGIMTQLEEKLDSMTDFVYGSFSIQDKQLATEISDLNDQIEAMEIRLEKREESMRMQFMAMETAVSRLNAMSSQLLSMMSGWSTK